MSFKPFNAVDLGDLGIRWEYQKQEAIHTLKRTLFFKTENIEVETNMRR